uniref:Uncharacterized protein n=1 Tax=Kalanchoe fedtschenkoi TaxID=63787 RepID=A0A7N0UZK4_KALFE
MDRFHGGRTICSFIDDEKKAMYESTANASVLDTCHNNQLSVNMDQADCEAWLSLSASEALVAAPPSPESPWLKSPLRSPSTSLFYRCVASLHRLDEHIYSVGIGKGVVFTSSESRRIRVWSKHECAERGSIKVKSGQIRSVLVQGHTVFTAHKDYKIRMWRFSSSQPADRFHVEKILTIPKRNSLFPFLLSSSEQSAHKDCISCMAYYNMEGLLYTGSWDKTIRVWNIRERICQDVIAAHEDKINSILINQEDGSIFSCSSDGSIKIWRRVCGEKFHTLIMTLRYQHCPVNALGWSSAIDKPSMLYSGSSDGLISLWVKEKNSTRFSHGGLLQGHSLNILCLTAIGNVVFSGSEDMTIRVWKRGGGPGYWIHECLAVLEGHRGPVKCLAACLDTEKVVANEFVLYSGGLDQSLKVWRIGVSADETGKTADEQPHRASVDVPHCKEGAVLSPAWVELKLRGEI